MINRKLLWWINGNTGFFGSQNQVAIGNIRIRSGDINIKADSLRLIKNHTNSTAINIKHCPFIQRIIKFL